MQQFPALAYAVRCVLLGLEDAVMLVNTQKEAIEWCSIPAFTSCAEPVHSCLVHKQEFSILDDA